MSISSKLGKAASSSGGPSAHFTELQGLYNQMAQVSTKIKDEAPGAIASDAATFASAINTLNDAVQQAGSSADIQSKALSDPKLKAATSQLTSSTSKLITWKTANCK